MARIDFQPFATVAPQGAPANDELRINANPEEFGAAIGRGMERAGQGLEAASAAGFQTLEFYGQIAADDATNKYQKATSNILFGDPNDPSKPGYYSLRGEDAMRARPQVSQQLDDLRNQFRGGLDPRAKLQFDQETRRMQLMMLDGVGRHYDEQLLQYGSATNQAKVNNAVAHVGQYWNDDRQWQEGLTKGFQGIRDQAKIEGWGEDVVEQKLDDFQSKAIESRAMGMLTHDPAAALDFVNRHQSVMHQQTYDALVQRLRPQVAREWVNDQFGARGGAIEPRGFGPALQRTLIQEGGYSPRDANGVPVNFGINQAAHPEVDVSKISRADAAGIYKRDYWDAINGDDLAKSNPALAHVAFDTAVIAGPERARQMMAQSGGDASKFMDLRDRYLSDLLAKEPEKYGRFAQAWTDRDNALRADIRGAVGGNAMVSDMGAPTKEALFKRAQAQFGDDPEMLRQVGTAITQRVNEFSAANATQTAELKQQLPDLIAGAEAGVEGLTFPEDRVRALLPPAQAQKWSEQYQIATRVGQVMRGAEWASPAELSGMLNDISSGQGVLSDMMKAHARGATTGPGTTGADEDADTAAYFRLREGATRRLAGEIERRDRMLVGADADPAAYVQPNPTIRQYAANLDAKFPQTFEQYSNAVLGLQDHLGVPEAAQHVLTRGQAMDLAGKIAAPGADSQAVMNGLQQQYGGAWRHVFNDLVTLGRLPAGYQAVQALDDPHDAALLSRALNEVKPKSDGQPGKDWTQILGDAGGKSVAADLRQTIRTDTTVMQLERSLSASGASARQVDEIVGSIETLAFAKKFYQGDPNAAQNAISSFISKYEFLPNGGARVPAKSFDAVTTNAQATLNGLSAENVAIPPVFGQTGAPSTDEYLGMLRASPTWITSPKEDALWLMDHGGRIVKDRGGKPVSVPFNAPAAAAPASGGGFEQLAPAL